jgi:cytochrome c553
MRDALLAEVASNDEKVRELSHYATSADGDRYCNYLKRHSRTVLQRYSAELDTASGLGAGAVTADELTMPAALAQCINCHETGAAPLHPFSHPDLLKTELHAPYPPHGTLLDEIQFRLSPAAGGRRMPLGLILADTDIESLQEYFAALASSPQ